MAHVLSDEKRLEVLAALVNGCSIRAASRMTGVHQDTIGRFAFAMGEGCARLHDVLVRDLVCPLVDMDEQYSWCGVRQANLVDGKHDPATQGEQWVWVAICRTSKLLIAWSVGKRTQEHCDALVADTRARLVVMPQITTDGLGQYETPIAVNFGEAAQYAKMVKKHSGGRGRPGYAEKFSPKRGVDFIERKTVFGSPDMSKATTYAIERSNLTNRQWNARLTRRTLSFSKLLDRHRASMALMFTYRNLCWVARGTKVTAAMLAGVTDRIWDLSDLMETALAAPAGEKPMPKPLAIPKPAETARELPAGRGWLRALDGGNAPRKGPPAPPAPLAVAVQKGQLPLFDLGPPVTPPADPTDPPRVP